MSYPGNSTLPQAVKDRVLSTFQQTLALYRAGRMDEVTAGCTLLLQMDPTFDPARKLVEKLRNPSLPIDVESLVPGGAGATRSPLELAREAMAARDFQQVLHLTTEILTDDLLNEDARILGDEAREKLEAGPFVDQFSRKAEQSLAAGNAAAAKMELEKARSLDPTHPDVIRVSGLIDARAAAPAASTPSPSFIVDNSAPSTGRPASQAADFGFTFEEEKPAEVSFSDFSFDTPAASDFSFQPSAPAAAPPAAAPPGGFSFDGQASAPEGEFDFATASVTVNDDDQTKIAQFIAEGDQAFAGGDYSQAIDLWSRIFLIDVTNDLASERIESAKAKRRQIEQEVEPLLSAGVDAFERGDTAKAQANLAEVLRLDPRNGIALDYSERLGSTPDGGPGPSRPYSAPPPDMLGTFDDEMPLGLEVPLIPPEPPAAAAAAAAAKSSVKSKAAPPKKAAKRALPLRTIALVFGLLILAAGGWFAWNRFSAEPEIVSDAGAALIARASLLAESGKIDQAIALLRDIKPGDPQHEKAMVMIADLQQKKATSAQLVDGIPAAQYLEQRLTAARTAFTGGDYLAAKAAFEQAMRVKPLEPDARAQYDIASQQASKLDAAKALFSEQKYREAIANLEPLHQAEPQNASVRRMLADAHFNLGAAALQEERIPDAIRELDAVLALNPNDELARRSRELANRYNGETKDLLYKIYVKYLPTRPAA